MVLPTTGNDEDNDDSTGREFRRVNGGNDRRGGDDDCGVTFAATKSSMTHTQCFFDFRGCFGTNYIHIFVSNGCYIVYGTISQSRTNLSSLGRLICGVIQD